jgi:hypothetical protein
MKRKKPKITKTVLFPLEESDTIDQKFKIYKNVNFSDIAGIISILEHYVKDIKTQNYLKDSEYVLKVLELEISILKINEHKNLILFEQQLYQFFKDFFFIRIIDHMQQGSQKNSYVWDNGEELKKKGRIADRLYYTFISFHEKLLSNEIGKAKQFFQMFNNEMNTIIKNSNLKKINLDDSDSYHLRSTLWNLQKVLDEVINKN